MKGSRSGHQVRHLLQAQPGEPGHCKASEALTDLKWKLPGLLVLDLLIHDARKDKSVRVTTDVIDQRVCLRVVGESHWPRTRTVQRAPMLKQSLWNLRGMHPAPFRSGLTSCASAASEGLVSSKRGLGSAVYF